MWVRKQLLAVTFSGSACAAKCYLILPEVLHFLGSPHPLIEEDRGRKHPAISAYHGDLRCQYFLQTGAGLAEALWHLHCSSASSSAQCFFFSLPFVDINPQ